MDKTTQSDFNANEGVVFSFTGAIATAISKSIKLTGGDERAWPFVLRRRADKPLEWCIQITSPYWAVLAPINAKEGNNVAEEEYPIIVKPTRAFADGLKKTKTKTNFVLFNRVEYGHTANVLFEKADARPTLHELSAQLTPVIDLKLLEDVLVDNVKAATEQRLPSLCATATHLVTVVDMVRDIWLQHDHGNIAIPNCDNVCIWVNEPTSITVRPQPADDLPIAVTSCAVDPLQPGYVERTITDVSEILKTRTAF